MHNIIKETYCTKTTLRDQNKKERPQYCTRKFRRTLQREQGKRRKYKASFGI